MTKERENEILRQFNQRLHRRNLELEQIILELVKLNKKLELDRLCNSGIKTINGEFYI